MDLFVGSLIALVLGATTIPSNLIVFYIIFSVWLLFCLFARSELQKSRSRKKTFQRLIQSENRSLYRRSLVKALIFFRHFIAPKAVDGSVLNRTYDKSPFSSFVFEKALGVSFIYPIYLVLILWLFDVQVFDDALNTNQMAAHTPNFFPKILMAISVFLSIRSYWEFAEARRIGQASWAQLAYPFVSTIFGYIALDIPGAAICFATTFLFSAVFRPLIIMVFTISLVFIQQVVEGGQPQATFTNGFLALAVITLAIRDIDKAEFSGKTNVIFILSTVLCLFSVIWYSAEWAKSGLITLIFLAILPLINSIFDYISYGITLTTLRLSFSAPTYVRFVLVFFDLFCSFILAAALISTTYFSFILINLIAPTEVLDIETVYREFLKLEASAMWVALLAVTTFLPTLVHLVFAALSLTQHSTILRKWVANKAIEFDEDNSSEFLSSFALGSMWFFSFFAPIVLLSSLFFIILFFLPSLGVYFVNSIELLIEASK